MTTSTLSFQEKFKDKIGTIGKEGIFGLSNRSEFAANLSKNQFKKEMKKSPIEEKKVNYSPESNSTKYSLFEVKETPNHQKNTSRKKTMDDTGLAKNGNYIINYPSTNSKIDGFNQVKSKAHTPMMSKPELAMNITAFHNPQFGHISQYNAWASPKTYYPVERSLDEIQNNLGNITSGEHSRINNFQRNNNIMNLNDKRPQTKGVHNINFTPVKVLEKLNSHNTKNESSSVNQNSNLQTTAQGSQRSFSTRHQANITNNLSKLDTNVSNISTSHYNKSNLSKLSIRGGSSEAHRILPNKELSSERIIFGPRGGSSEGVPRKLKKGELSVINENPQYKPYSLRDYKDLGGDKIVLGGLGPNIGTKEWEERANKMKKINEYAENLKKNKKIVLKPLKEAPKEVIEKIKKEKIFGSNRTKAKLYGKNIKKSPINSKKYFSENLLNNNLIKNIYDDNRLDFGNFKEENESAEEDVTEFFKDDDIKINNYNFDKEIEELQKKREALDDKIIDIRSIINS